MATTTTRAMLLLLPFITHLFTLSLTVMLSLGGIDCLPSASILANGPGMRMDNGNHVQQASFHPVSHSIPFQELDWEEEDQSDQSDQPAFEDEDNNTASPPPSSPTQEIKSMNSINPGPIVSEMDGMHRLAFNGKVIPPHNNPDIHPILAAHIQRHVRAEPVDERTAKVLQIMTKFSSLSYCKPHSLSTMTCARCLDSDFDGVDDVATFQSSLLNGDIHGFIAVDQELESIVVVFRGTNSIRNWMVDMNFPKRFASRFFNTSNTSFSRLRVHSGFANAYRHVKGQFLPLLKQFILQNPTFSVSFTGHSLGGAMAVLASMDAAYPDGYLKSIMPTNRINLFTLGAPRVGDRRFSQALRTLGLGNNMRVVNGVDIVPHLPPNRWGFVHGGTEIYLEDHDTPRYCDDIFNGGEDTNCAGNHGIFALRTGHHTKYFGLDFSEGCVYDRKLSSAFSGKSSAASSA